MKQLTVIIFIILLLSQSQAQEPVYFNNQYVNPDTYWGIGEGIIEVNNGGYIIAGIGSGFGGFDNKNIILGKLNMEGIVESWANFGEPSKHYYVISGAFIGLNDNSFLLGGATETPEKVEGLIFKIDNNLDTLWSRFIEDTISEVKFTTVRGLSECLNGNYVATGQKTNPNTNKTDILLMEIDPNGNLVWEKLYYGPLYDGGVSVSQTDDNGFIVGGFGYNPSQAYSGNALVIKTDSLGNQEWYKQYGGQYRDGVAQVELAHDGNFIVGYGDALEEEIPGYPYCVITILKVNPDGVTIWEHSYGGVYLWNSVSRIKRLPDGNYIAAGHTACEPMSARREGWLLKFSDSGDSIWYRQYSNVSGLAENNFYDIDLTDDGGFIMGGSINIYEQPIPPVHQLMWALKVDSMGCDTAGCATGVRVFDFPEIIADGLSAYPNPATEGEITFEFENTEHHNTMELKCFDIFGEEVFKEKIYRYQGKSIADISGWGKGMYFAVVYADGKPVGNTKFVVK